MKQFSGLLAATLLLIAAEGKTASATVIYNLSGVTLSDGGHLTGSFTTNDAINSVISANITVSTSPAFTYTFVQGVPASSNSAVTAINLPLFFQLDTPSVNHELRLIFSGGLKPTGSSTLTTSSYEFTTALGTRTVIGGSVTASAVVPEPSTLALIGTGLPAALGLAWRRRRSATLAA